MGPIELVVFQYTKDVLNISALRMIHVREHRRKRLDTSKKVVSRIFCCFHCEISSLRNGREHQWTDKESQD